MSIYSTEHAQDVLTDNINNLKEIIRQADALKAQAELAYNSGVKIRMNPDALFNIAAFMQPAVETLTLINHEVGADLPDSFADVDF